MILMLLTCKIRLASSAIMVRGFNVWHYTVSAADSMLQSIISRGVRCRPVCMMMSDMLVLQDMTATLDPVGGEVNRLGSLRKPPDKVATDPILRS
jgi:hypothetical protein